MSIVRFPRSDPEVKIHGLGIYYRNLPGETSKRVREGTQHEAQLQTDPEGGSQL